MNFLYFRIIIFILIILASNLSRNNTLLLSQTIGKTNDIKGYVKDSRTGEALPFANVMIKDSKHGTVSGTTGYFILVDVPATECRLIVSYVGYATKTLLIDNKNESAPITVKMDIVNLELQGVTVTANSQMLDISNKISQISLSPSQISSLPNIGETDIFRSLQLLPGINAGSNGSSELYIRGGTPDQNLILFDGMTIYHVDHFFGFFSAFNADAVKDVQVYKGGFPAEYGGRISSVVNLTGKTGDDEKIRFGAGANLLSIHGLLEIPIPIFEKGNLLIAGRRSFTDFIQSPLYDKIYGFVTGDNAGGSTGRQVRRMNRLQSNNVLSAEIKPDFYFYDINSKLTVAPTSKDIISLSLYNGKDDLNQSQDFGDLSFRLRETDIDANLIIDDYSNWGNFGLSGKWFHHWSDRFQINLLLALSEYYSDYKKSANYSATFTPRRDSVDVYRGANSTSSENNSVKDLSCKFNAFWQLDQEHRFDFGIWISDFKSDYISKLNDTVELLNRSNSTFYTSLFLQHQWQIVPFDFTTGLRVSHYQQTDKIYYEPRASVTYSLTDEFKIQGAWGYYYQFVNRISNEIVTEGSRDFWLLSDETLKPSFAEHQIIGIIYETNDYLLSIEAYKKSMDNLIEYSRRYNQSADYQNRFFIGGGTANGIEFLVQKKIGNLVGWVGYTLAKVEYNFPGMNSGESFPAEQDHRHDIKALISYTTGTWNFSLSWIYSTGNAYTAPVGQYFINLLDGRSFSYIHISGKNENRLLNFQRLDISASKKFDLDWSYLEAGISIFNLYNHKNVSYRQYNLNTAPATITDVLQLGFTPTIYFQIKTK